jgi:choline dehydrogenase-like flavoprotein
VTFLDLNSLDQNSVLHADVCIVGTGPAGASLAKELEGTEADVLVVESGGLNDEADTQRLYDIKSTGVPREIGQDNLRRRILGGSSHVWTGRCAPFSDIDLEPRSWIPYSGWPLTSRELAPYLERAGHRLGLGSNCYDESLWHHFKVPRPFSCLDGNLVEPMFWQFSKSPFDSRGPVDFSQDLIHSRARNLRVLLHANVTHINTDSEGKRFDSVEVASLGQHKARILANVLVLACGAIENARLLLASRRSIPQGIGNQTDMVGRFLMDHTTCVLGQFDGEDTAIVRERFGQYWLDNDQGRSVYLHGLALSGALQRKEQLLNCHAYAEECDSAPDDPWSALRRVQSVLRARHLVNSTNQDARILLGHLGELLRGTYRRRVKHRPQLTRVDRLELQCILEQAPDPESRVTLADDRQDALGMPLSTIHWKMSELERRTAQRMSELIRVEFERLQLPAPRLTSYLDGQEWTSHFVERAHPSGTTRMCLDVQHGVVDQHCQVHGVRGLFIAGSSVFPTSGAANPTLMIVAMALRLADRIKDTCLRPYELHHASPPPTPTGDSTPLTCQHASANSIRIGLVGTGQRVLEVYLPVLRQLSNRYQIVGCTNRSMEKSRGFESTTGIPSFVSARELIEEHKPTFIIAAVPAHRNEAVLMELLDLNVPVLSETPLAWSVSGARKIVDKAAAKTLLVAVAEQFPFLPIEQFRNQLISAGIFGRLYAVYNDFASYSYHGIAQLRRYLEGTPTTVRNIEFTFNSTLKSPPRTHPVTHQWQTGSVEFDQGATLFHHYSDQYADSDLCFPRAIRLYGTLGSMVNDEIRLLNPQSGTPETAFAYREHNEARNLVSISATLSDMSVVSWNNPYAEHCFSDEQIAVATLLDGMSEAVVKGKAPLYTADEFLTNIEVIQAFRYSAYRDGAPISLPLKDKLQKALVIASLAYWKKILRRRAERARRFTNGARPISDETCDTSRPSSTQFVNSKSSVL